jgi:hypothetical protein
VVRRAGRADRTGAGWPAAEAAPEGIGDWPCRPRNVGPAVLSGGSGVFPGCAVPVRRGSGQPLWDSKASGPIGGRKHGWSRASCAGGICCCGRRRCRPTRTPAASQAAVERRLRFRMLEHFGNTLGGKFVGILTLTRPIENEATGVHRLLSVLSDQKDIIGRIRWYQSAHELASTSGFPGCCLQAPATAAYCGRQVLRASIARLRICCRS